MKNKEFKKLYRDDLKVYFSNSISQKVKKTVLDKINGGYTAEYEIPYNYAKELEISDPGTTTDVLVDDNNLEKILYLSTFYVCFNACE